MILKNGSVTMNEWMISFFSLIFFFVLIPFLSWLLLYLFKQHSEGNKKRTQIRGNKNFTVGWTISKIFIIIWLKLENYGSFFFKIFLLFKFMSIMYYGKLLNIIHGSMAPDLMFYRTAYRWSSIYYYNL